MKTKLEKIEAVANAYLITNYHLYVDFFFEDTCLHTKVYWLHEDGSFCPTTGCDSKVGPLGPTTDETLNALYASISRTFKTCRRGVLPITVVKEVEAYLKEMKVI